MKWTTAVRTLEEVAQRCSHVARQPPGIVALRVLAAHVHGAVLDAPAHDVADGDLRVLLVVDVAELAWGTRPVGAGQWLAASGLERRPVALAFRGRDAAVQNHAVVRPLPLWTLDGGTDEAALAALAEGRADALRAPRPDPTTLAATLDADLAVALGAVRATSRDYDRRRWAPGSPVERADALAAATAGYLDLLAAEEGAP